MAQNGLLCADAMADPGGGWGMHPPTGTHSALKLAIFTSKIEKKIKKLLTHLS